ncbi:MAG TPA: OmpA family protein [Gemmatimonadaceae bacterium]|nr:OmpA family protein [Gemmatimonadaceae bacterium]
MSLSLRSGSALRASALLLTGLSMTACVTSKTFKREMTATRAEISTERTERLRADSILGADLSGLRTELKKELADLRTEFDAKIVAAGNGMKVMLPVNFAFDDAMVKESDRAALERFSQIANKYYPGAVVTVEGFADPAGTQTYNQRLSLARAENVKRELASKGMDASLIRTMGFGSLRQVVPGAEKDQPGADKNRRVVFVIESAETRTADTAASSNQ